MRMRRLGSGRRIGGKSAPMVSASLITATAPKTAIPQSQTATPAARAAQTDFAGQADGINTARIMQDKAGNIVGGEFGFGNTVQRYDPKKIAWIMGRGASGGSLSTADKAIYDRMMYLRAQKTAQEQQAAAEQKALDAAHAEDERKRMLDAAEWDRQNKIRFDQANAVRDDEDLNRRMAERRANEEYDRRTKSELDYKARQQRAALDAENAKYEELNKRYGIDAGTRLSEKDYNDLAAGRTKWGYSQRDQADIDKINQSYDDSVRSGSFSADELAALRAESDAKIAAYRKGVQSNDQPPTAEQLYNGSFAAPDGTRLIADGKGGLSAIPGTGPQKEVETPEQKLDTKMKDYLLKEVGNARKEWETAVSQGKIDIDSKEILNPSDKNGAPLMIPNPNYGKTFDEAAALKAARNSWNAVYGFPSAPSVQTAQPSVAGATPVVENKWDQYKDKQ